MVAGTAYQQPFDVAIIGGGIAGLSVALRLPGHMRVALFTKGQLGESNTRYAQGGLSVALGEDDCPELHFQDTLVAGAGLCDKQAVRILVEQAPSAVRWLIALGVRFDRAELDNDAHKTVDGLLLGREAAHSRWRVLHAGGDATGAEIERALTQALRKRSRVVLYEETFVSQLLVRNGVCIGVQAVDRAGHTCSIESRATVLANGGAGKLWLHTSNPGGATADGLMLAWRAGAALTDLEFMQFHPTVLATGGHLISEAVRGEGAYLRNHAGERFMPKYSTQAELAPRDVVARAILNEMLLEQAEYQYLDLRHLYAQKMHARFPTISALCRQYGLDLASDLLPVAPAAHYYMGGVMVDSYGRTTLEHLYAVGEVACTGVHGANRLASNSLLEGLVYGIRIADVLSGSIVAEIPIPRYALSFIAVDDLQEQDSSSCCADEHVIQQIMYELRAIMWQYVSLIRDEQGLLKAMSEVQALRRRLSTHASEEQSTAPLMQRHAELVNMLQVAEMIVNSAIKRRESRGSHWRSDYQQTQESLAEQHFVFQRFRSYPKGLLQAPEVVETHV
ncbi:MAG: L-aspartate oxidase [Chloroflexi bacterium]|nr:L-aspartate oxidase [Ktedonobacteraceae bacterium]MBV9708485.1 L-aspartate oxidase [Chloroflexota bacterium]